MCIRDRDMEILVCIIVYVDRFINAKKIYLTLHEMHRVILAASLLAMKFYFDDPYNNKTFSRIGGITLEELNELEANFLIEIDYNLAICKREYKRYEKALVSYALINVNKM
eukprot:TRINITY_DN4521_c0_g1_i3.p1 TRINITY_DN4521_c0_g1~~TRINITY_DN4521_c0_g1_i3.p1  ORF type:complete len:111 (+),score=13.36 TRINITY_DN4521_c0_g1_i3:72-404(+)